MEMEPLIFAIPSSLDTHLVAKYTRIPRFASEQQSRRARHTHAQPADPKLTLKQLYPIPQQ